MPTAADVKTDSIINVSGQTVCLNCQRETTEEEKNKTESWSDDLINIQRERVGMGVWAGGQMVAKYNNPCHRKRK